MFVTQAISYGLVFAYYIGRVDSPKRTQKNLKGPKRTQKEPKRTQKEPKRRSRWFQTNIKHNYLASYITKSVHKY